MSFAKDCATSRRDPQVLSTFEQAGGLYGSDLSYVSGTSSQPLLGMTIGEAFDAAARQWSEKTALVVRHQDIRWTYAELAARVDTFAAGLLSCGLEPGDRIGIWAPNRAEWVIAQFATAKAGLILVNINPAYRSAELGYVLRKVKCRALITATAFRSSDYLAMLSSVAPDFAGGTPGDLRLEALPDLRAVFQMDGPLHHAAIAFDEVRNRATPEWMQRLTEIAALLQCDDAINIQFTSGTTGAPKGATLTHHNLLNNGFLTGQLMRFTSDDRLCIPVPFYHCFGMVLANLTCVTHGAAMVVPGEAFEAKAVLETIEAERCTALHGVPTMFIAALEHPEFARFDLTSLRTGIMAGSPCPIEVMRRVIAEMCMSEITIGYGMTETSPLSFQSRPEDTIERRVSTVGRIHPHVEVKIVDDNGRIVPRGVAGELCTRGYSVMKGYWDDAEKTAEAIDEGGWMHTGDLATLGRAGVLQHRRAHQGHGHSRWREHLSSRDRGVPVRPSRGAGRPGVRSSRREVRRGALCLDQVARRRLLGRGGGPRLLSRPHCPLQGAAARSFRDGISNDGHWKDPEVRDAPADVGDSWCAGAGDRLTHSLSGGREACTRTR